MANPDVLELIASNREVVEVSRKVAQVIPLVHEYLQDREATQVERIPLPNVSSKVLAKVLEFCVMHAAGERVGGRGDEGQQGHEQQRQQQQTLEAWDKQYVAMERGLLMEVMDAAVYLQMADHLELCCEHFARQLDGKSIAEIQQIIGVQDQFMPEEQPEIEDPTGWAFY